MNAYRMPLDNGRTLIVFRESLAAIDPDTHDAPRDYSHTDTCNGDHTDVSGRCGEEPIE